MSTRTFFGNPAGEFNPPPRLKIRALVSSTALSRIPAAAFELGQVDAQLFELLDGRLGMALPRLGVSPLCVPDLALRPLQPPFDLLRVGDPPRSHHGRCRRVQLADRQLRIFFSPMPAACEPGTSSSPPRRSGGASAPDSGAPRIGPGRSRPCRPRSTVPRASE